MLKLRWAVSQTLILERNLMPNFLSNYRIDRNL